MNEIVKQLQKARENKLPLKKSRVQGDIVATIQVSKRDESSKYSEMSLYEIEGNEFYLVVHEHRKYPSPEQVKNKVLGKSFKLSFEDFNVIVQGIINYREKRLQESYVNTYSYIIGWCQSYNLEIQDML